MQPENKKIQDIIKQLQPISKAHCTTNVIAAPVKLFDITVEDNHNYFIRAGDINILSHNCLEFVVHEIIGPVVVSSRTTSLVPEIQMVQTGIAWKVSRLWAHSMSNMLQCKEKNNLIVQHVFQDLEEHPCIIIPTDRTEHVKTLCTLINDQAIKAGLTVPDKCIAQSFYGAMSSSEKKKVLANVDNGSCRVLVSMRSMIKQGIDLKTPTMLYSIIPETATADAGSPMFLQLSNRPCTPLKDKRQPIVKIFIDNTDLSVACFKSLFSKEIKPNLVASAGNNFTVRYKITEEHKKIAYNIINTKNTSSFNYFAQLHKTEA